MVMIRIVEVNNPYASTTHQCAECRRSGIRYRLHIRTTSYGLCETCVADLVDALDAIGNPGHAVEALGIGGGE